MKSWVPLVEKILIYPVGGIGNQLFSFAFSKFLASLNMVPVHINETFISLGSNYSREPKLQYITTINQDFSVQSSQLKLPNFLTKQHFFRKLIWHGSSIALNINNDNNLINGKYKKSKEMRFRGYFQEWTYAEALGANALIDFSKEDSKSRLLELFLKKNNQENPVMMHIRLGDFLRNMSSYKILPEDYYLNALDLLQAESRNPVWIFCEKKSELVSVYKKLAKRADVIVDTSHELKDYEVFETLSKARQLVTANSTFSLWAGWISSKNGSRVVSFRKVDSKLDISNFEKWYRFNPDTKSFIAPTSNNKFRQDREKYLKQSFRSLLGE